MTGVPTTKPTDSSTLEYAVEGFLVRVPEYTSLYFPRSVIEKETLEPFRLSM